MAGESGKTPLVNAWSSFRVAPSVQTVTRWAARYPNANVGIIPHLSGLVVVDIDTLDADLLEQMILRFGQTVMVVRTPGGHHLYYCARTPVGSQNLRSSENLPIEIKCSRTLVVAPPSVNQLNGQLYRFIQGGWDQLPYLPYFDNSTLVASHVTYRAGKSGQVVEEGKRNNELFRRLLAEAAAGFEFEELLNIAFELNETSLKPKLECDEVRRTVESAWGYEIEGKNWFGKQARAVFNRAEIFKLAAEKSGGSAMVLLGLLRMSHGSKRVPFAIARVAMVRAGSLPGWTEYRIRVARDVLLKLGYLRRTEENNKAKKRRAVLYVLTEWTDQSGDCQP